MPVSVAYRNEARPKKWGRLIAEFYERVKLRLPQGIRFLLAHGEMAIETIHQYRGVDIARDPEAGIQRLTIVDCRLLISKARANRSRHERNVDDPDPAERMKRASVASWRKQTASMRRV